LANPLPNEEELYKKIKKEGIRLEPPIWDFIYQRMGDDLTAMNLICQYYLSKREPLPTVEAEKILVYTRDIKNVITTLTATSQDKILFPQFKENINLDPKIRELITHHLGNDVYVINLIVGYNIDPSDSHPIPLEDIEKILNRIRMIKEFLEKLREATLSN